MDSAASDAITLDKSDLSALSSDVRIGILRAIDSSEGGTISAATLADELSIGKSTLHQHLAVLETAGIVCADKSRKWHMYSLTRKGKCILHPKQSFRFVLALSSSVFFAMYGVYMLALFFKGTEFLGGGHVKHLPPVKTMPLQSDGKLTVSTFNISGKYEFSDSSPKHGATQGYGEWTDCPKRKKGEDCDGSVDDNCHAYKK